MYEINNVENNELQNRLQKMYDMAIEEYLNPSETLIEEHKIIHLELRNEILDQYRKNENEFFDLVDEKNKLISIKERYQKIISKNVKLLCGFTFVPYSAFGTHYSQLFTIMAVIIVTDKYINKKLTVVIDEKREELMTKKYENMYLKIDESFHSKKTLKYF